MDAAEVAGIARNVRAVLRRIADRRGLPGRGLGSKGVRESCCAYRYRSWVHLPAFTRPRRRQSGTRDTKGGPCPTTCTTRRSSSSGRRKVSASRGCAARIRGSVEPRAHRACGQGAARAKTRTGNVDAGARHKTRASSPPSRRSVKPPGLRSSCLSHALGEQIVQETAEQLTGLERTTPATDRGTRSRIRR